MNKEYHHARKATARFRQRHLLRKKQLQEAKESMTKALEYLTPTFTTAPPLITSVGTVENSPADIPLSTQQDNKKSRHKQPNA